jgi:hypothetical protein
VSRLLDARRALSPAKVRAAAEEWAWARGRRRPGTAPLSWELDAAALAHCAVGWPRAYEWAPARIWADPIRTGMQRHVRVEQADIPQPYRGVVIFEWRTDRGSYPVAIDYWDRPVLNEGCSAEVALYFKMQHLAEGYGLSTVIPGGFVPASPRWRPGLYGLLPRARAIREEQSFTSDVYGRFSPAYAADVRGRAVELLEETHAGLRFEGGLKLESHGRFLMEAARARVCLDLPGNGDLCHRLVEYLAVGSCVVALQHVTVLHVPLVDGVHVAYARRDLSDLVEVCLRYAHDADAREGLARGARDFFDRYLHRDQLGAYYLHELTHRL